jgi:hypothetical protein
MQQSPTNIFFISSLILLAIVVLSSSTEFDAVFAGSVRKFKVRSILLILVIPPMLSDELLP